MNNRNTKKVIIRTCLFVLLSVSLSLLGCSKKAPPHNTRLVLYLVIDQFPHEYIHRFKPFLTGGIKRLLDEGKVFEEAYFEHANTMTGPGHAVLSTGFHPSASGIVSNEWYDRHTGAYRYCVGDSRYGRSPAPLLVPTIADRFKDTYGGKVISISGKDRSAILMGGKDADAAYWYDKRTGTFISSSYYPRGSSTWVKRFNEAQYLDQYFGAVWEPLQTDRALRTQARVIELDEGFFQDYFPHSLGGPALKPEASFYESIYSTPFLDRHVVRFAKHIIEKEALGFDSTPDYLAVSFSALDTVGHTYGPNSPEVLDTFLRLDKELGSFFTFIDEIIGLDKVQIVLSSDHGIQPLPEFRQFSGEEAHRFEAKDIQCIQRAGLKAIKHYSVNDLFLNTLYLNKKTLKSHGIERADIETRMKEWLEQCESIEKVWIASQLFRPGSLKEAYSIYYRNNFHLDRSPDFFVQLKKFTLASNDHSTNHGTPYSYDTHVPVIYWGAGVTPGSIHERISIVDVPVTFAAHMGVEFEKEPHGTSHQALLGQVPASKKQKQIDEEAQG